MSPSAEPASAAAQTDSLVPLRLLEDGEVILLAVKPSGWQVLLVSWPAVLLAVVVGAAAHLAWPLLGAAVNMRLVVLVCSAAACSAVTLACFQWQGRLYVLTNRRILRVAGVLREQVFQSPLSRVRGTHLAASPPERVLGLGSLLFALDQGGGEELHWRHLSRPLEVQRAVEDALRHVR